MYAFFAFWPLLLCVFLVSLRCSRLTLRVLCAVPQGAILKGQGHCGVYMIGPEGWRHVFPSPLSMQAYGVRMEDVKEYPLAEIQSIPEGAPMPKTHPCEPLSFFVCVALLCCVCAGLTPFCVSVAQGDLIRQVATSSVFMIDEYGHRRGIHCPACLEVYRNGLPIHELSAHDMDCIPQASNMPNQHRKFLLSCASSTRVCACAVIPGRIVRGVGHCGVFYVDANRVRHVFLSWTAFLAYGHNAANIREFPLDEVMAVPEGAPMPRTHACKLFVFV